jgi:DNA-binding NarL/FixJ family response regulator
MSKHFDPSQSIIDVMSNKGIDEGAIPPLLRGYGRFLNAGCALARRRSIPECGLTAAEMTVLRALPNGLTVVRLAAALGKSPKTVEGQVSSIYAKLNVSNRAQAIERARELGIYV